MNPLAVFEQYISTQFLVTGENILTPHTQSSFCGLKTFFPVTRNSAIKCSWLTLSANTTLNMVMVVFSLLDRWGRWVGWPMKRTFSIFSSNFSPHSSGFTANNVERSLSPNLQKKIIERKFIFLMFRMHLGLLFEYVLKGIKIYLIWKDYFDTYSFDKSLFLSAITTSRYRFGFKKKNGFLVTWLSLNQIYKFQLNLKLTEL